MKPESRNITISHYRAMTLDGKGCHTQGSWANIDDMIKRIVDRGLDSGKVMRVEREHEGKWIFVQNIVIPD